MLCEDENGIGCTQKVFCFNLESLMTQDNCRDWPAPHIVAGNGAVVYICDEGLGSYEYKYKLKQCGYKYEKRNIKCCAE
jgi:hypothetical protein